MRQLVIDTATEALSVALFDNGDLVSSHHEIAGRGHAEKLLPLIAAMDGGGRADEILVDSGPGSFTGVRVGLAAARALAYGWNCPLKAYSSLSLLAAMARETDEFLADATAPITIVMNGGHGECFWQMFDSTDLSARTPPTSTPIPDLVQQVNSPLLFGSGAAALCAAGASGQAIALYPDARFTPLLVAGMVHADSTPLYGRGADAKTIAERKA